MSKMYQTCRELAADKTSEFWIDGQPRRTGALHRIAYWAGRDGMRSRWARGTMGEEAWRAGRDDRIAEQAGAADACKSEASRDLFCIWASKELADIAVELYPEQPTSEGDSWYKKGIEFSAQFVLDLGGMDLDRLMTIKDEATGEEVSATSAILDIADRMPDGPDKRAMYNIADVMARISGLA